MGGRGGTYSYSFNLQASKPQKMISCIKLKHVYFKLLLTDVKIDKRPSNSKKQMGTKNYMKA